VEREFEGHLGMRERDDQLVEEIGTFVHSVQCVMYNMWLFRNISVHFNLANISCDCVSVASSVSNVRIFSLFEARTFSGMTSS